MSAQPNWGELASYGSDLDWWNAVAAETSDGQGNCGGCGDFDCHLGHPCGNVPSFYGHVCDLCPTRVATGQIAKVREVTR